MVAHDRSAIVNNSGKKVFGHQSPDFCRRLDAASPNLPRIENLGDDQPGSGCGTLAVQHSRRERTLEGVTGMGPVQRVNRADTFGNRGTRELEYGWIGFVDEFDPESSQRLTQIALVTDGQMGDHGSITAKTATHTDRLC